MSFVATIGNKISWDTLPERGFFDVLQTLKGENKVFPSLSPPCNFVPLFKLAVENHKHPNFEWRGGGRGVDSFVLWSYLIWV